MHTCVCVSGGKKCLFCGKFDVLCFLETPVLRFTLSPHHRRLQRSRALCLSQISHAFVFSVNFQYIFVCIGRSNCSQMFFKTVVLKNFANSRENSCVGVFFNKVAACGLHLYYRQIPAQLFSSEICEIFKNTYFEEHLRTVDYYIFFHICSASALGCS